ncbi:endonuclease Q family protein [Paenibacillus sp. 1001270B_150601_E10]|uniref:endonuclease Q family protein n=1 Tax=Paenibacillus sp. 1001270B_150601_E10 TaxID=2787079 RepID=UPI00189DD90B|nr:endonuclease Q family protein [Paenibacillus sp. 1001270B_150601_E10]
MNKQPEHQIEHASPAVYYGDFHIHIGATSEGKPVKMSGSRNLTFEQIAYEAADRKGLQLIGIIDCHAPGVLKDIEQLLQSGEMSEHPDGGIRYKDTTIMLGTEIEVREGAGSAHVLCYLPNYYAMKHFSEWMSFHIRNITLSTQRIYVDARTLQAETMSHGGIFIPAHVFTPHKSVFGNCTAKMGNILDLESVDAIELGLSADTGMAERLSELDRFPFLTNSDAHSLKKIAREYNALMLQEASFKEWSLALHAKEQRCIAGNYGLNPLLGKYHRTTCINGHLVEKEEAALIMRKPGLERHFVCPICGSKRLIRGVYDRIEVIADRNEEEAICKAKNRPPYHYQIPLEYIPGVGAKTLEKLLHVFRTEMNVLHEASLDALEQTVGADVAARIHAARSGDVSIQSGGGGVYGRMERK